VWFNQPMRTTADLRRHLGALIAALEPVAGDGGRAAAIAGDTVDRIRVQTLPRIDHPDRPLVVAVSGLTGVGKSTLVNALTGADHCAVGPLRPTTTAPTVVAGHGATGDGVVFAPGPLTDAVTLVDLPPGAGSELAPEADLHLFVTTPSRYADAEGWDHLTRLTGLAIPTWVVVMRIDDGDDVVIADLERRLDEAGLDLLVVPVPDLADDRGASKELADMLAAHAEGPGIAVDRKRIAALARRAGSAAADLRSRRTAGDELRRAVDAAYAPVVTAAEDLARPEQLGGALDRPWEEIADRLALVLTHRIGAAAEAAAGRWAAHPTGAVLVSGDGVGLWRHGADTSLLARDRLLAWPDAADELVASRLRPRRWWHRRTPDAEVAALVRRKALGAGIEVGWRLRPRFSNPVEVVAGQAANLLADIASGIVVTDKQRFIDRLDPVDPARIEQIERASAAVLDTLDQMGGGGDA